MESKTKDQNSHTKTKDQNSHTLETAVNSLGQLVAYRQKQMECSTSTVKKSVDQCFGEMIIGLLEEIEEGQEKAMLKLEIQKLILNVKYAAKQTNYQPYVSGQPSVYNSLSSSPFSREYPQPGVFSTLLPHKH